MNSQTPGKVYTISDFECIKIKVLNWANRFSTFCFLDNHQYQTSHNSIECLLAAGVKRKFTADTIKDFYHFLQGQQTWLFGHMAYDLKNEIETGLSSSHKDNIGFQNVFFFEPEILIHLSAKAVKIEAGDPDNIWHQINLSNCEQPVAPVPLKVQGSLHKEEYINIIKKLQEHIRRGDCYEINFCHEFFAKDAVINPTKVYQQLSSISPNPFSALYRLEDKWLICASPERFLRKEGNQIISQPIKGTARRITDDAVKDKEFRLQLLNSQKDKSENVMVVDLVRNDLSKICEEGTVKVDELFGVYAFPQVYQMVSTISGKLLPKISFTEVIEATFPMGSMTGAPKRRVMELIEQYETTRRGIFSGAVGYISPNDDFDFNVVIRSIMYNSTNRYLSFQAGSGITFYSDAEKEWEECLLKAAAIKKVLETD